MNQPPDEFADLRRLLALKRHEQPPPGYFSRLPDRILVRIEQDDLSEHSTWWEWLVERFDARPVLAGAYACAISGLMLLGFKISHDLQGAPGSPTLASGLDPLTVQPGAAIKQRFANPGNFLTFLSNEPVFEEPVSFSASAFPVKASFSH
jgi:hypothetical protein